jgi:hypothetical protein
MATQAGRIRGDRGEHGKISQAFLKVLFLTPSFYQLFQLRSHRLKIHAGIGLKLYGEALIRFTGKPLPIR